MQASVVDLRSDTLTKPTPEMREAIAGAAVGDEQRGEDPSVNALCSLVAELLGKEAAMFLPSCTMGNQLAILMHCPRGNVVLVDETAHILRYEAGAPAAIGGVLIRPLAGERGVFSADALRSAIPEDSRWVPPTSMVSLEQTSTDGCGRVWPLDTLQSVATAAHSLGLSVHIDGARLMNAVVASGISARRYAEPADSVVIDLSKGLGCPVGAVLAGSTDFIRSAWRWKQRLGGAMRQAGILAAAGVYALQHHVDRLAEDHANARYLADRLVGIAGVGITPSDVETNVVIFDVSASGLSAAEFAARLLERGVHVGIHDRSLLRAVTYLGVVRSQIEQTADAVRAVTETRR